MLWPASRVATQAIVLGSVLRRSARPDPLKSNPNPNPNPKSNPNPHLPTPEPINILTHLQSVPSNTNTSSPLDNMYNLQKFNISPATKELDAAFRRSVVIYDSVSWGRERILVAMQQIVNFKWRVSELPDGMMMVEGPHWWTEKVIKEEGVDIEGKTLKVTPYLGADAGLKVKSVWVRILGFPMKLWSRVEFEKLVDTFAVVFELDSKTRDRLSFKEAKLRLRVTNPDRIPPRKEISFMTETEEWRWSEVQFIVDTPGDKLNRGRKRRRVWVKKPDVFRSADPSSSSSAPKADVDETDEDLLGEGVDSDLMQGDATEAHDSQTQVTSSFTVMADVERELEQEGLPKALMLMGSKEIQEIVEAE